MTKKFKLTDDQKMAKHRILAFVKNKGIKEKFFTLSGKGGTGKTFVIGNALKDIIDADIGIEAGNIICATIAHSAKNVLNEAINNEYPVMTIAKLLDMQIDYGDEGELLFVPPKNTSKAPIAHPNVKILIIDECSMISTELFDLIMSMKRDYVKVIAMGDHCQLPPVGDPKGSPFLDHIGNDLSVDILDDKGAKVEMYAELTKILRYKGPVIELGEKIREQVEICMKDEIYDKYTLNKFTQRKDNVVDGSGYKFYNNPSQLIQDAAVDFMAHMSDPMHCVVLAYKNKTVNIFNTLIRRQIYGEDLAKFMSGELVISSGGYNFGNSKSKEKIYNGEVFRVAEVYYENFGPSGVPSIIVTFKGADYRNHVYIVDPEKGYPKFYARLNELKAAALKDKKQWVDFYTFKNQFAIFDYAYSRTSHKV